MNILFKFLWINSGKNICMTSTHAISVCVCLHESVCLCKCAFVCLCVCVCARAGENVNVISFSRIFKYEIHDGFIKWLKVQSKPVADTKCYNSNSNKSKISGKYAKLF